MSRTRKDHFKRTKEKGITTYNSTKCKLRHPDEQPTQESITPKNRCCNRLWWSNSIDRWLISKQGEDIEKVKKEYREKYRDVIDFSDSLRKHVVDTDGKEYLHQKWSGWIPLDLYNPTQGNWPIFFERDGKLEVVYDTKYKRKPINPLLTSNGDLLILKRRGIFYAINIEDMSPEDNWFHQWISWHTPLERATYNHLFPCYAELNSYLFLWNKGGQGFYINKERIKQLNKKELKQYKDFLPKEELPKTII